MPRAVRPAFSRLRAREGENVWPKGMKTRTTSLILAPLRPDGRVAARSLSTPGGPSLSLLLRRLLLSLGGGLASLGGTLLLRPLLRFLCSHALTSCWREWCANGADCRFLLREASTVAEAVRRHSRDALESLRPGLLLEGEEPLRSRRWPARRFHLGQGEAGFQGEASSADPAGLGEGRLRLAPPLLRRLLFLEARELEAGQDADSRPLAVLGDRLRPARRLQGRREASLRAQGLREHRFGLRFTVARPLRGEEGRHFAERLLGVLGAIFVQLELGEREPALRLPELVPQAQAEIESALLGLTGTLGVPRLPPHLAAREESGGHIAGVALLLQDRQGFREHAVGGGEVALVLERVRTVPEHASFQALVAELPTVLERLLVRLVRTTVRTPLRRHVRQVERDDDRHPRIGAVPGVGGG